MRSSFRELVPGADAERTNRVSRGRGDDEDEGESTRLAPPSTTFGPTSNFAHAARDSDYFSRCSIDTTPTCISKYVRSRLTRSRSPGPTVERGIILRIFLTDVTSKCHEWKTLVSAIGSSSGSAVISGVVAALRPPRVRDNASRSVKTGMTNHAAVSHAKSRDERILSRQTWLSRDNRSRSDCNVGVDPAQILPFRYGRHISQM